MFTATTESSATKTALSQNGENYDVLWLDGDQITIVDAAAGLTARSSLCIRQDAGKVIEAF